MIGYRTGMAWDKTRTDWDGLGPRPLAWSAWYPASPGTGTPIERETQFFETGDVLHDAVLAEAQQFPVVLLSHGTGGTPESLGWLARRLVGTGKIVIGAHHHGNTGSQPYRPEGFVCWWERAPDLSAILSHLADEGPFAGRLMTDSVSVIGFSLGCHTVLTMAGARSDMSLFSAWLDAEKLEMIGPREMPDAARHIPRLLDQSPAFQAAWSRQGAHLADNRVSQIIAIAPPPPVRAFDPGSVSAIATQALLITGEADKEAPTAYGADWLRRLNPSFAHVSMGAEVGHYSFLDAAIGPVPPEVSFLFADDDQVNRLSLHEKTGMAIDMALADRAVSTTQQ